MKIRCEHCGGDLTKTVRSAFARYDAGPLECPDCHAFQSRSLTPADFLIDQLTTLSCMLGLILLLPVFAQIQSELRKPSVIGRRYSGSGSISISALLFPTCRSPTVLPAGTAQESTSFQFYAADWHQCAGVLARLLSHPVVGHRCFNRLSDLYGLSSAYAFPA